MRRLKEPALAVDILRDFGASYARTPNVKRVSALYFEKLANSLNQTAAQLQESDHLELEKSRIEDPSDSSLSSEGDKAMIDSTSGYSTTCTSLPSSARCSSRTFTSRSSETHMEILKENLNDAISNGNCNHDHNGKSICPITAEAWIVLSAFLANQIKFGYEMEKLLQTEMAKLGLIEKFTNPVQEVCRHAHFSHEPPTQFA
ncbi:hypothetical protein WR25_22987 [Diploscapter pachys]|uniref:Uncharacterized protein n=1 Tax=Diploscapter pachys TaxID=2018661 RepID=A0A2A2KDS5_9BILA|nr:hypothetical protein WR25_22987 [Diploscapter pachys]